MPKTPNTKPVKTEKIAEPGVIDYTKAVLQGAKRGFSTSGERIVNKMSALIDDAQHFMGDASVLCAVDMPQSSIWFDGNTQVLQALVEANPKIYEQSMKNMLERMEPLKSNLEWMSQANKLKVAESAGNYFAERTSDFVVNSVGGYVASKGLIDNGAALLKNVKQYGASIKQEHNKPSISGQAQEPIDPIASESREKATVFVNKIKTTPPKPKSTAAKQTPQTQNDLDNVALMDELVDMMASRLPNDSHIQNLYKGYQSAEHAAEAFATFQQQYDQHLRTQSKNEERLAAGKSVTLFCAQVAELTGNTLLSRTAQGIGAAINIWSGLGNLGSALGQMSGGFSMASMTAGFNAVGLIIGGISILNSIFDSAEEDGNELGEAFNAINRNIIALSEQMHRNHIQLFEKMLDFSDELSAHDRQEYKRFEQTLRMLGDINQALSIKISYAHQKVEGKLDDVAHVIESYMDHLIDDKTKIALRTMEKMSPEDRINNLQELSSTLANWLIDTASIDARTGYRPAIEDFALIEMMQKLLTASSSKDDIPFGLYHSLLQNLSGALDEETAAKLATISPKLLINPRD